MDESVISAEVEPRPHEEARAARALQGLGFRVLHVGTTISVQAPASLWQSMFNVSFETRTKPVIAEVEGGEITYQRAHTDALRIPNELRDYVADVLFQEPPEFFP